MPIDIDLDDEERTEYEKAKIIGSRALQLSMGAPIRIDLSDEELEELNYNPVEIAKREFEADELPIGVKRVQPHEKGRMY
jgi:DNA-directed RNA polymerase subunit K/omega